MEFDYVVVGAGSAGCAVANRLSQCGNYLVDVDPTYVLRKDKVVARVERCPCGQGVCVQCHQAVKNEDFETHCCPEVGKKGKQLQQLQDDQALQIYNI